MGFTDKIVRGMVIMFNNEPHLIIEREFYKPGKGNSLNRTKLRNIKNGKVVSQTYKSGEKVEELDLETKNLNYLYLDGETAYFMDPVTFDQSGINLEVIPGGTNYLKEDEKYIVMFYEGEAISVQLPPKMVFEVTETAGADKGNTAGNATKDAVLDTGLTVQVPLFVKTGDKIVVNTEYGEYYSKEN